MDPSYIQTNKSGCSVVYIRVFQQAGIMDFVKEANLTYRNEVQTKTRRSRWDRKTRENRKRSLARDAKYRSQMFEPQLGMELPAHPRFSSPVLQPTPTLFQFDDIEDLPMIDDSESSDDGDLQETFHIERNFFKDDFRASTYREFLNAPMGVRNAIGARRFFRIYGDIVSTINVVPDVPFEDRSRDINDAFFDLPEDDESKYIEYRYALGWVKIIFTYTAAKVIVEYYKFNRAAADAGRDIRSPTSNQYARMIKIPTERACRVDLVNVQTETELIAWRASIDKILALATTAMRQIGGSGGRGFTDHTVMTVDERQYIRGAEWFRRQNCCIAVTGIYNPQGVRPLPFYDLRLPTENLFIANPQMMRQEQLKSAITESEDMQVNSVMDRIYAGLKTMAQSAGSAVAGGAMAGLCDAIKSSGPGQFLANLTDGAVAISKTVLSALTLLWDMFPTLAPILGLFAAWRFSETGSVTWAVLAVFLAFIAGKKICQWFMSKVSPIIMEIAKKFFGPNTAEASTNTLLDSNILSGTDEDYSPVGMIGWLMNLWSMEKAASEQQPNLDDIDITPNWSDKVLNASPREINEPVAQPQVAAERPILSAEILASLASTALLASGVFMKGSDTHGIIRMFAQFNGVALGFSALIRMGLGIVTFIIERTQTNVSLSNFPFSSREAPVVEYLDSMKEIFDRNSIAQIPKTPFFLGRIETMIEDGRKLLAFSQGSPLTPLLLKKINDLDKIRGELAAAIGRGGLTKAEPVGVVFAGAPGTFKSMTMNALAQIIVTNHLKKHNLEELYETFKADKGSLIFAMPAGDHFDGISDLTLVLLDDDFLQEMPSAANRSPGTAFVKMNNGLRFNPPMAALQFKNNVFIKHILTLVSTNATKIVENTMLDVTALCRRMHYIVETIVPKDFNLTKDGFDPKRFTYRVKLIDHNQVIVGSGFEDLSFMQLVKLIDEKIEDNARIHEMTEANIDTIAEQAQKELAELESMRDFAKQVAEARKIAALAPSKLQELYGIHPSTIPTQGGSEVETFVDAPEAKTWIHFDGYKLELRAAVGMTKLRRAINLSLGIDLNDQEMMSALHSFLGIFVGVDPYDATMDYLMHLVRDVRFGACLPMLDRVEVDPFTAEERLSFLQNWRTRTGMLIDHAKRMMVQAGSNFLTAGNVVGVITAIAASFGLKRYYDMWFQNQPQYVRGAKTKGEKTASRDSIEKRLAEKRNKAKVSATQAGYEVADIAAIVEKNRFPFGYERVDVNGRQFCKESGFAMGVCDNFYIVPAHFLLDFAYQMDREETVSIKAYIKRDGQEYRFGWNDIELISEYDRDHDRAIIRINVKQIPQVASILKHLAWQRELDSCFKTVSAGVRGFFCYVHAREEYEMRGSPWIWTTEIDGTIKKTFDLTSYRTKTREGDCGTPIVLTGGPFKGKFVGIHTHGDGHQGHASLFSRDWVQKWILGEVPKETVSNIVFQELETTPPAPQGRNFFPDNAKVIREGVVPASATFLKNDNIPWSPNGPSAEYKERAFGASDTRATQFTLNRAKFNPKKVENAQFEKAVEPIAQAIATKFRKAGRLGRPLEILSFETAIRGDATRGIEPLRVQQSTGYPLASRGLNRSKFFTRTETGETIPESMMPSLAEDVALMQWQARQGIPLPVIWSIFLKAEKLKKAKIEAGKTRDVNCAPLAFLVLCRMYMGEALALINAGANENECLINVDAASAAGWNGLAQRLSRLSGGKNCEAGDFEGFDHCHSLLTSQVPRRVFRLLYSDVSDTESRVIESIFDTVFKPKLIFGSCIEEREGTMPSGFLGTTVTNCIINMALFRFAWMALHQYDPESLLSYDAHISSEFCGDDNIFEVSDIYKDDFTPLHLASVFATVGYRYTSADKTEPKAILSPLENHTMLKRGFRFERAVNGYVGPLDLTRVLEIPLWTKEKDYDKIGADNCTTALGELSLHGKEVFEEWAPKIQKFAAGFWEAPSMHWETVFDLKAKADVWTAFE